MRFFRKIGFIVLALFLSACAAKKSELTYEVYTGTGPIPVVSTIFYSGQYALLIDAQFTQHDARIIANRLQKRGVMLDKIYITQGEGEFYFGLEALLNAFPKARVIATQETVNQITRTADKRIQEWQSDLGRENPTKVILPQIIKGETFYFDGYPFEIKETAGQGIAGNYLWVPEKHMLIGSQFVFYKTHGFFMNKSASERNAWKKVLTNMYSFNPSIIIPGYTSASVPMGFDALDYSYRYLSTFNQIMAKQRYSSTAIKMIQQLYPQLSNNRVLELSVRSINGDVVW